MIKWINERNLNEYLVWICWYKVVLVCLNHFIAMYCGEGDDSGSGRNRRHVAKWTPQGNWGAPIQPAAATSPQRAAWCPLLVYDAHQAWNNYGVGGWE